MIYMLFFRSGLRQKSPSVIPFEIEPIESAIEADVPEDIAEAATETSQDLDLAGSGDIPEIETAEIEMDWDPIASDPELLDDLASDDLATDGESVGLTNKNLTIHEAKTADVESKGEDGVNGKDAPDIEGQIGAVEAEDVAKADAEPELVVEDVVELDEDNAEDPNAGDTIELIIDQDEEAIAEDIDAEADETTDADSEMAEEIVKDAIEEEDDESEEEIEPVLIETNPEFTSGVFTVGASGEVAIDLLFDGGKYQGELAIFSLNGMEEFAPGSEEFIQEAASRALSNSTSGYVVFSDQTEGAKFSGELGDKNYNSGDYQGMKTFAMGAGDQFGFMLVANGRVQQVFDNPGVAGALRPLFSMATANPGDAFHVGQIADVTGDGNTFVMEDMRVDGVSDRDYNDIIFQVRGATGTAISVDEVIDPAKDWQESALGKEIIGVPDVDNEVIVPPEVPPETPPEIPEIPPGIIDALPVDPLTGAEYLPGAMILKFESTATEAEISAFAQSHGAIAVENLFAQETSQETNHDGQWKVLQFAPNQDLVEVRTVAAQESIVSAVELNYKLTINDISNDSLANSLWGFDNIGQTGGLVDADIDLPEAWRTQTGSKSITVAIIDTGGDYRHPDLADNTWRNQGEVFGNRIDDDRNGFVDDIYGYDFANRDGDPMDDQGHGTHVAGTIGAVGNNNRGVVGVNQNVSLMHLKFLNSQGNGSTIDAVRSVDYATRMGANVINASFGGGSYSQAMFDAISRANNAGILFVAAAGNEGNNNDFRPSFPANYDLPNVISVAATDHRDQLASFSNFGQNSVDLGAPGVNILSTLPGNRYRSLDGTSMAAPHVAGAAALLLAEKSDQTPRQLKNLLMETTDPVNSLQGKTVSGGRLNVNNALNQITPPPKSTISMTVTDESAAETKVGETPNPGRITLTRSGGDNSKAETVSYSLSGTATNGVDYSNLTGSVTFAAGQTTVDIPINIIDDNDVEGDETVTISLIGNSNYNLGTSVDGTITIADNDLPGSVQWINQFGTSVADAARDITVDINGNAYVVGLTVNPFLVTKGVFLKYDAKGNLQWTRELSGVLSRIIADDFGNIYATGKVDQNVGFQLLKYDADGNILWSRLISYTAITTDELGNIYAIPDTGGVAKYDSLGNLIWESSKLFLGNINSLSVDTEGNCYATGSHYDDVTQKYNPFLVKYDNLGNQIWLRQWESSTSELALTIAVDNINSLFIGGLSSDIQDGHQWLTKYDSNGNQVWRKTNLTNEIGAIGTIKIDFQENLVLGINNWNNTVIKLDGNGNVLWSNNISSPGNGVVQSLDLTSIGEVYLVGDTPGSTGGINAGETDIWIAKLNP